MEEVLTKMKTIFTSNEFHAAAREMGLSRTSFNNGISIGFLLSKGCKRLSKKTWRKPKEFKIEPVGNWDDAQEFPSTEQECIDLLKRTGKYKIMKITLEEL